MRQLLNSPLTPTLPALLSRGPRLPAGLSMVWPCFGELGARPHPAKATCMLLLTARMELAVRVGGGALSFSLHSVLLFWRGGGSAAAGRAWEALGTVLSHKTSGPPQLGSPTDAARAGRCWGDVITRCQR